MKTMRKAHAEGKVQIAFLIIYFETEDNEERVLAFKFCLFLVSYKASISIDCN